MAKTAQLQIRVSAAEKAVIRRRARPAGLDVLRPVQCRIDDLLRELRAVGSRRRSTLAALSDLLAGLLSTEFGDTTRGIQVEGLEPWLQNYVAAMVEHAAMLKGVEAPAWTRQVQPLDDPHFAVSFPALRSHLLRSSPVAFKRRNVFVDATVGDRV